MRSTLVYLLILAIVAGQLIKLPVLALSVGTALDLTVGVLCLIGLIRLRLKLSKPPLFIRLGLVFVGVCCLSLLLTPLHLQAIEYLLSFSYTLRFGLFILLGWVIYSDRLSGVYKHTREIFIAAGVLLSVAGLLQLIFIPDLGFLHAQGWDPHFLRVVSTFLDPNFLGVFLGCVLLMLALYQGAWHLPGLAFPEAVSTKLNYVFFIVVYLADTLTFSRSALLMLTASFLMLSWLKKSVKLLGLTIVLTTIFVMAYSGYNQTVAGARHINRTTSAELRLSSWHLGLQLVKRYPVLGVGFNSYRFGLEQNHLAPGYYTAGRGGSSNDSSLLFVISTTGAVGLTVYGLFLLSIFYLGWAAWRKNWAEGIILLAGLSGLMINSLFINSLFYPWILLWIILESTKSSSSAK